MRQAQHSLESTFAASRRLPAPVCPDPVVVLSLIVRKFGVELGHAITHFNELAEARLVVIALTLVDITPLAGLVVMVILGGDRNLVSVFRCQGMDSRPA